MCKTGYWQTTNKITNYSFVNFKFLILFMKYKLVKSLITYILFNCVNNLLLYS